MNDEPLTGRAAVEAIGLAARLGNRDARFDGPALMKALRSRAGRLRIVAGLTLAVAVPRFHVERRSGDGRRASRSRRRRGATAAASVPGRPAATPELREGL